jgi:chromosome segregation ATPase
MADHPSKSYEKEPRSRYNNDTRILREVVDVGAARQKLLNGMKDNISDLRKAIATLNENKEEYAGIGDYLKTNKEIYESYGNEIKDALYKLKNNRDINTIDREKIEKSLNMTKDAIEKSSEYIRVGKTMLDAIKDGIEFIRNFQTYIKEITKYAARDDQEISEVYNDFDNVRNSFRKFQERQDEIEDHLLTKEERLDLKSKVNFTSKDFKLLRDRLGINIAWL